MNLPVINPDALLAIVVFAWILFWGVVMFLGYKFAKNKTRITYKDPK